MGSAATPAREAGARRRFALARLDGRRCSSLRPHVAATNLVMVYLLGVVAVAMRCSRRTSVAAPC